MIKIQLPDGSVKEYEKDDSELLPILRHTAAHIMAEAVQSLYPNSQFAIGPAIDNGFYYDIDFGDAPISAADLPVIEKKMKEIIEAKTPILRDEISIPDAKKAFKNQKYKQEILADLEAEGVKTVSVYSQGAFADLCRGPHLPTTGYLDPRAIKLQSLAGAYWRGDSKNRQLTRIYGLAFAAKAELEAYLKMMEEAALRDHRKLGQEMDLFHFEPEFAPGAVFWHPLGWTMFQTLIGYMRSKQNENEYIEISTPTVMNRVLWETSEHWTKYASQMYYAKVRDEDGDFAVKPVNCPGCMLYFKQGIKSYRDLPLKVAEFGKVNRYESSGSLFGLMRVREFTQDDAHIFCTPDQVEEECVKVIKLIMDIYKDFGFEKVRIKLSTRPEIRQGSDELWDTLEEILADSLTHNNYEFTIFPGEGAFYGPKLEFVLTDAIGRDWQCGTLQVDMNLPERFDINYVGKDGEKHRPVMLHRALFGSLERFSGILIEHYAGKLPFWLAPRQVVIATITDEAIPYAYKVLDELKSAGIRAELDISGEKIGYKVRAHSLAKVPYLAIVGKKEEEGASVSVRRLGSDAEESLPLKEFVKTLSDK